MNEGKVEQIDNPLTIFNKPKSAFVSEFVGGHNIISIGKKMFSLRTDNIVLEHVSSKIKNNAEKMIISDIEFQGSSVKIILSNSKYKHFNVTMSDSEFFSKDLKIRDEVSCSWNLSNLHELQ